MTIPVRRYVGYLPACESESTGEPCSMCVGGICRRALAAEVYAPPPDPPRYRISWQIVAGIALWVAFGAALILT